MHWLPQNDILADHRTRAFMNHAGVNSMYEVSRYTFGLVACLQQSRWQEFANTARLRAHNRLWLFHILQTTLLQCLLGYCTLMSSSSRSPSS